MVVNFENRGFNVAFGYHFKKQYENISKDSQSKPNEFPTCKIINCLRMAFELFGLFIILSVMQKGGQRSFTHSIDFKRKI